MEEIDFAKVSIKNGNEIVTQTDAKCQGIIIEQIKAAYPDHGFVAEEGIGGKLFKQSPRGDENIWWAIDPIDGTNNFANGMLLFTVSIAAMYQGEPVVGVIFEPATDSMYTAVKDGEAQLNDRRITTGKAEMDMFTSIGLDSHFEKGVPPWACNIMARTKFRNLGTTALHFAYVAKGGFAATIASKQKLWDIAAGSLIVQSAGATATDWKGNSLFPVDIDNYQGGEFFAIAGNKKVHSELLQMIG